MTKITVEIGSSQEVDMGVNLNNDTPVDVMLNVIRVHHIKPGDGSIWKMKKGAKYLKQFDTLKINGVQDLDTVQLIEV